MKQNNINLSDIEKKYLISLVSDPEGKDVDIAKSIKASKATVGRIGKKLRSSKLIQGMIPVLDLDALGADFFAVILFSWNNFADSGATNKLEKEISDESKVVYFTGGESSDGLTHLLMVGFKDMPEYHTFLREFRAKYGNAISRFQSFFIPTNKIIKQDYSGLVKNLLNEKEVKEK